MERDPLATEYQFEGNQVWLAMLSLQQVQRHETRVVLSTLFNTETMNTAAGLLQAGQPDVA